MNQENRKPDSEVVDQEKVTQVAVELTLVEVFLGSVLHGFKVPFGGHFLSLNQGFFLLRSIKGLKTRLESIRTPIYISSVVGILKCLSPAGNKLGPMTSITVQGFLFSIGIMILGNNLLGHVVGMIFLSLWAFFQPILTLYILFGADLFVAFSQNLEKLQKVVGVSDQFVWSLFLVLLGVKATLAAMVPFIFRSQSDQSIQDAIAKATGRAQQLVRSKQNAQNELTNSKERQFFLDRNALFGSIKDLFRPFFIFSVLLMILFFYSANANWTQILIRLLQPIGAGFVFFYISRLNMVKPLIAKLRKQGYFPHFFQILENAAKRIF